MSDENDARTAELWPEEVDGSINPLDAYAEGAYLSAAAEWLVTAERAHSVETDSRAYPATRTDARATVAATTRFAEVAIAMAGACGTYQWRKSLPSMNDAWTAPQPALDPTADVRAAVQADIAEHETATIRPASDPEPPEEGVLLAMDGGWFLYAVDAIPPRVPGDVAKARWLLVRHYAEFLRWQTERGTRPTPVTWDELQRKLSEHGEPVILRRPTAEERAAFYGPEPDPLPAKLAAEATAVADANAARAHLEPEPDEMYSEGAARALERCAKAAEAAGKTRTTSWLYECASRARAGVQAWPDAPAYKGPVLELEGAYRDQLEEISDKAFETLLDAVLNERVRRGRENGTPW